MLKIVMSIELPLITCIGSYSPVIGLHIVSYEKKIIINNRTNWALLMG